MQFPEQPILEDEHRHAVPVEETRGELAGLLDRQTLATEDDLSDCIEDQEGKLL